MHREKERPENSFTSGQQKANQESCPMISASRRTENPDCRAVKMAANNFSEYRSKVRQKFGGLSGKLQLCGTMENQENMILRAPELEDAAFLYALENDQKLWQVSATRVPFSHLDLEQYILSASRQEPFVAGQVRLIIDYRKGKQSTAIGIIDLYDLSAIHRRGGVGIVIDEKYRNRSLAGKALDQLIHYAFNLLNLHQLFCSIGKENQASLRLFQSRHFEITGERKEWNLINGKWQDEYFLQLINS